jgi:cell division protease FtsH
MKKQTVLKDKKPLNKKNGKKAPKYIKIGNIVKVPNVFGNVFFYVFLFFATLFILDAVAGDTSVTKVSIGAVIREINDSKVQDITVSGDKIDVLLRDGTKLSTEKESGISFDEILRNNNVDRAKIAGDLKIEHKLAFDQILSPILMFGLPILVLYFIFRQIRGQSGEIMSFGKSRARIFDKSQAKITFKDVAGNEEAKREMIEIVDFLKNPEKYINRTLRCWKNFIGKSYCR